MKFSLNQQDLQKSLNYCQGVIEKRSTLPILSNVLLEVSNANLTITATDLDLIFIHKIPNVEISEEGKTTSSSSSEDAKSKNDFESDVNSFFSNLEKDRDRVEQISTQSEVLKIAAKIRAEYEFLWQKPKNLPEDLFVKVLISIAPSGEVVNYEILNKSGNEVFDRSIRIALDRISSFDFIKNISRNDFEKNFREFNLQFSSN